MTFNIPIPKEHLQCCNQVYTNHVHASFKCLPPVPIRVEGMRTNDKEYWSVVTLPEIHFDF